MAKAGGLKRRRQMRIRTWHSWPLALASLTRGTLPDRVANAVRRRILNGDVRRGERLEPMRELSRELGVSVGVVREGLAQLKGEGLVEIRQGERTFVARRQRAARVLRASRRRASRRDLRELRQVIDPAVARVAARRASPRAITDLRFLLGERNMAARDGNPERFVDADLELHLAVTQAARNVVGTSVHRLAASILRSEHRSRALADATDERLTRLHRALVEAIDRGREREAERAARVIAAIEARPP